MERKRVKMLERYRIGLIEETTGYSFIKLFILQKGNYTILNVLFVKIILLHRFGQYSDINSKTLQISIILQNHDVNVLLHKLKDGLIQIQCLQKVHDILKSNSWIKTRRSDGEFVIILKSAPTMKKTYKIHFSWLENIADKGEKNRLFGKPTFVLALSSKYIYI